MSYPDRQTGLPWLLSRYIRVVQGLPSMPNTVQHSLFQHPQPPFDSFHGY